MEGTNTKRYFIIRHGRQAGPYTREDLRAMNIIADTPVWNEEIFDWTKADSFGDLKEVLRQPSQVVDLGRHWLAMGRKRRR